LEWARVRKGRHENFSMGSRRQRRRIRKMKTPGGSRNCGSVSRRESGRSGRGPCWEGGRGRSLLAASGSHIALKAGRKPVSASKRELKGQCLEIFCFWFFS
jgi:hypothetical protein